MACEQEQVTVATLTAQLHDLLIGLSHTTRGGARLQLQLDIKELNGELKVAKAALARCLAIPPVIVAAPANILEIQVVNPAPPDQSAADWAARVVGSSDTFLSKTGPVFEWTQVLDPGNEYDDDTVGAAGWVIMPGQSGGDLEFAHPWGNDFEFSLALDPAYKTLLAPGNGVDVREAARARQLGVPDALLGVEVDGGLVPGDILGSIREGDRVAMFGRWIVDTGHFHPAPSPGAPVPGFRTEIHPPLLMATANVHKSTRPDGIGLTRAVFTSRPFLVGQTYTTNRDTIYQDGVDDDGALFAHLTSEIGKVTTIVRSSGVEAHPKIKTNPFRGAHLFHFIVRPPPPPVQSAIMVTVPPVLSISFNFTVRTGCVVQVSSDGHVVNVFISMNGTAYKPPQLPPRTEINISTQQLIKQNTDVAGAIADLPWITKLAGLLGSLDGVTTDTYPNQNNLVLRTSGAVLNASALGIHPGLGMMTIDSQPYPVTGWLEVEWVKSSQGFNATA